MRNGFWTGVTGTPGQGAPGGAWDDDVSRRTRWGLLPLVLLMFLLPAVMLVFVVVVLFIYSVSSCRYASLFYRFIVAVLWPTSLPYQRMTGCGKEARPCLKSRPEPAIALARPASTRRSVYRQFHPAHPQAYTRSLECYLCNRLGNQRTGQHHPHHE